MRVSTVRHKAVLVASIAAILLVGVGRPPTTLGAEPHGMDDFMWALGQVESGGDYYARNETSGAYGKYQIIPSSWRAWAGRYLGDVDAKPTPTNQEKVASGKIKDLYRGLDRWRRVAYWWLTGSSQTTGWSDYASAYVDRVMARYQAHAGRETRHRSPRPERHAFSEKSGRISYDGRWRSASLGAYAGGAVRYATNKGASATFTFTGSKVVWYGPVGPTRGKARVFVDGRLIRTVDLHAGSFDARRAVFSKHWSKKGAHTLRIVVLGTRGHPYVAIDRLVVVG